MTQIRKAEMVAHQSVRLKMDGNVTENHHNVPRYNQHQFVETEWWMPVNNVTIIILKIMMAAQVLVKLSMATNVKAVLHNVKKLLKNRKIMECH